MSDNEHTNGKPTNGEPSPESIAVEPRLTLKQKLFVSYYLGESKGNQTDAARRAGYACPTEQGSRLLTFVNVNQAIEAKLAEWTMPAKEVLLRLADLASLDMNDFYDFTPEGPTLNLQKAHKGEKTHLFRLVPVKDGLAIEFNDPRAALVDLGKYYGLFKERREFTGADGGPIQTSVSVMEKAENGLIQWQQRMQRRLEMSLEDSDPTETEPTNGSSHGQP